MIGESSMFWSSSEVIQAPSWRLTLTYQDSIGGLRSAPPRSFIKTDNLKRYLEKVQLSRLPVDV